MSRIHILPEILSNKIAAGEVVERPASVVKELLENALDAGSDRIIVEVEKGGRSLIRVSDNGRGMSKDDALLSIERYATSKIQNDSDLYSIQTLGFRGEALPSIASVSRFELETRQKESDTGTRIYMEGGKIVDVKDIGAPAGTQISVRHLFFNTPARRKFLKTVGTEMGHIADCVATIALGWPFVRFKLIHNEKTVKNWIRATDVKTRVIDVLGKDFHNHLLPVYREDGPVTVAGWISDPSVYRSSSRGIHMFVNQRYIRDDLIVKAVLNGYASRLMKGRFPVAVFNIEIDPETVDVNVHPTKKKVRFSQARMVYDAVLNAVSLAFAKPERKKAPPAEPDTATFSVNETRAGFENRLPETGRKPIPDLFPRPEKGKEKKDESLPKQASLWEKKNFSESRVIGQFKNAYIVCENKDGLTVIDQHAAHERILYETLKNREKGQNNGKQRLLIPESFDLSYREAEIMEKMIPELEEAGFEIEPFGGRTFVVKSVASSLSGKDVRPMIREIVETLARVGAGEDVSALFEECVKIMACHGAIRSGQKLSDKEIVALLDQLNRCDNPYNCPHGRPTCVNWSDRFLEKAFKRVI
jgi:DNA mismatch repair protein MutL